MMRDLESTDLVRTIAMLRQVGPRGLTELDTDGSNSSNGRAIDGGPPFRRLAARICDARKLGHTIKTHRDGPGRMARYVLDVEAVPAISSRTSSKVSRQAPLDVEAQAPQLTLDDDLRLATPEEEALAARARLLLEDPS